MVVYLISSYLSIYQFINLNNRSLFYSSPSDQDNFSSSASASHGFKADSTYEFSQSSGHVDDSGEWVWSNVVNSSNRSESKNIIQAPRNSSENGDNFLIDFDDKKKTNTAKAIVKVKTAEEEAWDMLNS